MAEVDEPHCGSQETHEDSTPLLERDGSSVRPEAARVLPLGSTVNARYRVEEYLGHGGMGVVYRVFDPLHPDRQLALKSIRRDLVHPALISRFKAEFRNLTQLQHPNVAVAYDFESMQGSEDYFFTMEFVRGRNILRATEGASRDEIFDLLVQVCRALSYVHSRKLIHYDIKPGNVLVDDQRQVKVLDFGLAAAKTIGARGTWAGTPAYMAPELTDPDAYVDHRADLYSLGIMAYELFCRRPPFRAGSQAELLRLHRFQQLEFDEPVRQAIPPWQRAMIERLCAKHPADRHPTGNAVIEEINLEGGLSYPLETRETRESYVFSSRFVNRRAEYRRLTDFVACRTHGRIGLPPVLLVCGQSGSGKSRLLREVRHDAQLSRVCFCQGRCFEGGLSELRPLTPVVERLIALARSFNDPDLVRSCGPELVKMFPGIHELQGFEPSAPIPQVHKESVRLREAVTDFLIRMAGLTPYVVFIDDLQWAPAGLTDLLADLALRVAIAERRGKPVPIAILGAYRSEEVAGRPLQAMLEAIKTGGGIEELTLERLREIDVGEMLGSMLGIGELPETFIARIARETAGNPFFVEELLRGLVEREVVHLAGGSWKIRDEFGRIEIPITVAAAFRRRASMLGDDARALLEVMAVCGRPVAADVLAQATRLEPEAAHAALAELVDRRMIREVSGPGLFYGMSHDRLRETVYGDLEPEVRAELHLTIARSMETVYARELEEHVFEIADHFNAAVEDLSDRHERDKVAGYNELAGRRSKRSGAFEAAGAYLRSSLALLPADAWSADYEKIASISKSLMEVEYLCKDLERAEQHWREHVARARTNLERAEAHIVKADALAHLGRLHQALATIREALPLLGARHSARPGKLSVLVELLRTKRSLQTRSPDELLALGDLKDPEKRALLKLLSSASAPAFLTHQENLFAFIAAKGVRLAATYGNAPLAAMMYAAYAFVRQQAFGDLEGARRLAELAMRLTDRFDAPIASGRTSFIAAAFIFPWSRPLRSLAPILLAGYRDSLRGGDLLFAGFHANVLITQQCMFTDSVDSALRLLDEHEDFLLRLNNPHTINEITALRRMMMQLSGRTRDRWSFDGDGFDEARFLRDLVELDDAIPIGFFYAFKLKALFVLGLYDRAFELSQETDERVASTRGQYVFAEHAFFHFLAVARQLPGLGRMARARLRRGLDAKRKLMKEWAQACPENFRHKQLLMEAEWARIGGDVSEARRQYEEAATSAKVARFPLNEAVACELAGRFEVEQNRGPEATSWLRRARDGYERWGAHAKLRVMDEEYPALESA